MGEIINFPNHNREVHIRIIDRYITSDKTIIDQLEEAKKAAGHNMHIRLLMPHGTEIAEVTPHSNTKALYYAWRRKQQEMQEFLEQQRQKPISKTPAFLRVIKGGKS